MIAGASQSGLGCRVLVLNKHYLALRVIGVRRAFSLLLSNQAEVISWEEGIYSNYDFESWREISELKKTFEANEHDWISTVNFDIAVPRIIRLLFYDRLPRRPVKFNRRNIFARDRSRCPVERNSQPLNCHSTTSYRGAWAENPDGKTLSVRALNATLRRGAERPSRPA